MDELVKKSVQIINSAGEPVSFSSIIKDLEVSEKEQKTLLETLMKRTDIFFHDYNEDGCDFVLFWRKDIREKCANESFAQWEKNSAIV